MLAAPTRSCRTRPRLSPILRVAYFIQSHTAPQLLQRLVATLHRGSPESLVVVGHDATRLALDPASLPALGEVHVRLRDAPVRRGEFSCLEPYLDACAWLLAQNHSFDWLVYLSGQDYPVRPVAAIARTLADAPHDGFLRHWDLRSPENPWGWSRSHRRYYYQYRRLPEAWTMALRLVRGLRRVTPMDVHLTYGPYLGWRARPPMFSDAFPCFGGFQWHVLRRACIEELANFVQRRPDVVGYFRRVIVPDEAFVQTVLLNSGRFRFANDNRRFSDTHNRPGGNARVLTLDDWPQLVNGAFDFARKFDPHESAALLDRIDHTVHGRSG